MPVCSCAAHYFGIFCLTAAVLFNLHLRAGDGASAASLRVCYFFQFLTLQSEKLKKKKLKKKIGCRSRRTTPVCCFFFVIQIVFQFALTLTWRPLYPARSEVDKLSLQLDFSVQVIICFPFACSHLKLLVLNRLIPITFSLCVREEY